MEKTRMIYLKNMVNAVVSVVKPEMAINRKWNKRNQVIGIPYDIVEQLLWDNGFRSLINSGILYIENMQDKIDLGLEPEGAVEPENIIVLEESKMEHMWKDLPLSVFKREISNLPSAQIDNLISYAIEHDIADSGKCAYIKEITKKDILVAISRKQDRIAEEAREAAKKETQNNEEGRRR